MATFDENNNECNISFAILPDDCLIEICNYLDLKSIYRLSKTNKRIYSLIVNEIIPTREIDFSEISEYISMRSFAQRFMKYIRHVTISEDDIQYKHEYLSYADAVVNIISMARAENLRKVTLRLSFTTLQIRKINRLAEMLTNVEELELISCNRFDKFSEAGKCLSETIVMLLSRATKLRSISFKRFIFSPLNFLPHHMGINIRRICFDHCEFEDVKMFQDCIKQIGTNLVEFKWLECKLLTRDICTGIALICETLADSASNLETIILQNNYPYAYCVTSNSANYDRSIFDDLLRLTSLRRLSIGCAGICSCTNFCLFISKLKQITELLIDSPLSHNGRVCLQTTKDIQEALPAALSQLTQLRYLRLNRICRLRSDEFILLGTSLQQLEHFELANLCPIYQRDIIAFMELAKNLNFFDLSETKLGLTSVLYDNMLSIIKNRRDQSSCTLKVHLASLRANQRIFKNKKLKVSVVNY